jgi:NADPH-dependent 2,4-dienoyl-CoA reductase/sulfur reductase-like enzyme
MPRLFIIGGSDAGISAALRARELAPEWQVAAALGDRYPNFSICGIPYFLSKEVGAIDRLSHRKADDIRALGVELLLDRRAEQIHAAEHRVITRGQDGISEHLYDKLVIATGAASIRPPISGLDLPGVFLLRWAGDALAFDEFLTVRAPKQVIIVGGGYIGLEMAEAMTHRKIEVTIVEMAPAVMTNLDTDLGQRVGVELERNGVRLTMKQAVSSISRDGDRLRIEGDGGFCQIADMILVAVGARP